jgi:glycosyltransferase involved in cell wall biosynthesis
VKLIFVNRFCFPDLSPTAQLLSDLAFSVAVNGTEVHVITSRSRYEEGTSALPKYERVRGVQIHRVWTSRFGRQHLIGRSFDYLSFYLTAGVALWRLAAAGDTVVVKTDPPLFCLVALPIVRRRRARLVNWLQDLFPEIAARRNLLSESGELAIAMRKRRNAALCEAALNIAISQAMEGYLRNQGIESDRIEVIPNWSDGRVVFPVPIDQNNLRGSWGLTGKFVIGHSGNLGSVHDKETLKPAIERLGGEPDVEFLFIGGGSGYVELLDQVERDSLENAQFYPYQPLGQLHLSLSVPDVHLVSLAPEMEGLAFASKLYGILAAGRPAIFIGAPESEAAQILKNAECGLAVEAGKPEQLVEAIRYLKDNPEIRRDMGRRARALFERAYDKEIAIASWRRVLLPGERA